MQKTNWSFDGAIKGSACFIEISAENRVNVPRGIKRIWRAILNEERSARDHLQEVRGVSDSKRTVNIRSRFFIS